MRASRRLTPKPFNPEDVTTLVAHIERYMAARSGTVASDEAYQNLVTFRSRCSEETKARADEIISERLVYRAIERATGIKL